MIHSSLLLSYLLLLISSCIPVTFSFQCEEDLTLKTLQTSVYDRHEPSLVIFHGPEKPEFSDFVNKMASHGVCVSYFSCEGKANMKVCQTMRLSSVPGAALFVDPPKMNPYTKKNFREAIPMVESLQEKSLEKFVNKAIPHNIQMIKSIDASGFSSSQPSVLLFTSKSTISLAYRILSFYYRESLSFYQIRVSEDESDVDLSEYGVTSLPSLSVRTSAGKFVAYTGDIKNNNELLAFLEDFGPRIGGGSSSQTSEGDSGSTEFPVTTLSVEQLNSILSSNDDSAFVVALIKDSSEVPQWWSDLARKCVGSVKAALFKCGSGLTDTAQQLCSFMKDSDEVLTVLPYSLSSKKKALSNPSKYILTPDSTGKVDIETAVKRAQDSIPENALPVLAEADIDNLLGAAHQTGTIAVLALSGKAVVPNSMLRNVALTVKGKVQFGFVAQPSQNFLQRIGNPVVPSILILIPPPNLSEQFQIMIYDTSLFGPLSYNSIVGFINTASRFSTTKEDNSDQPTPDIPKEAAVVKHVTTPAQWEALCGEQFKGLCAIAFMGAPEGVDPADTASVEKFQSAVDQLSSAAAYNFIWIDASCQVGLAEQLEVTGGATPALVVYSPLKNRYAKYVGKFAQSSIVAYLEGMASGRVTTFPLPSIPKFEDKNCVLPSEEPSGEFEADDFLAEIQREEAEKAAAIKRALEEEKKKQEQEKKENEDKKKKKKKTTKKKSTKSDL